MWFNLIINFLKASYYVIKVSGFFFLGTIQCRQYARGFQSEVCGPLWALKSLFRVHKNQNNFRNNTEV